MMCPLNNVHQRLEDAARMWKSANDSYFSPDDFRIAVQPCIQALRSVTWVLQNSKDKIHAFEDWYSLWQQKMKEDAVLRWLVESRNRIEKQGDLQTRSKLKVTLSRSWHDEPVFELALPPMTTAEAVADQMMERLPVQLRTEEAILKIERQWVDAELPDREILEALSHSYGILHELIEDGHRRLSPPRNPSDCESNSSEKRTVLECMVNLDNPRVLWLKLKDREQVVVAPSFRRTTEQSVEAAGKHYGIQGPSIEALKQAKSFQDECAGWFQIAKQILQADKHHRPTALLKTEKTMHTIAVEMHDRAEKHIALRHLAQQAKRLNARAALFINEVWLRPALELSHGFYAVDTSNRREALVLHGLKSDGAFQTYSAEFHRIGGTIVLGEDKIEAKAFPGILLPFCEIWKITPPKDLAECI